MSAHDRFEQQYGIKINYTVAFAAAHGKSLLGSASTETFGGRVFGSSQETVEFRKDVVFKNGWEVLGVMALATCSPMASLEKFGTFRRRA